MRPAVLRTPHASDVTGSHRRPRRVLIAPLDISGCRPTVGVVREVRGRCALTALFLDRDLGVAERAWTEDDAQHTANAPDGREHLAEIVGHLPPDLGWEPGMVVASEDHVMIHGRHRGRGPQILVGVDVVRVADGRLAEHWEVLQPETPAPEGPEMLTVPAGPVDANADPVRNPDLVLAALTETLSGRPMFTEPSGATSARVTPDGRPDA